MSPNRIKNCNLWSWKWWDEILPPVLRLNMSCISSSLVVPYLAMSHSLEWSSLVIRTIRTQHQNVSLHYYYLWNRSTHVTSMILTKKCHSLSPNQSQIISQLLLILVQISTQYQASQQQIIGSILSTHHEHSVSVLVNNLSWYDCILMQ